MASSLLTTDRRWAAASTRKSSMTVLGRVPKPINLPSQRLENNGLNPNMEIAPKGTLTWCSKPTPTTPNAWTSSSILSTKNDGSSSSSSHLNGRPSSGGGSRPSTAGSDSLGSPSAWALNSRPSSASGTVPSAHLPMTTNRPRSAETRPGSSQLSRFADNASENVKASIRTIDRPGSSTLGHGFTLSTGDFPTLGSEKSFESNSQRGHSSKGRPTSSSGKETAQEQGKILTAGSGEVLPLSNNQTVDIMKTEQHAHTGGAPFPATGLPIEGLQPQPYPPNFRVPALQFDSWRAPPGHSPDGIWHRGAAQGGPYRPVGSPGSFPVEPFGYCAQFPANSEAAARQGSGPGGYHPKNGDAYHPMPPNSYMINQPVIPVRPVYQGPVPYDGYFGPRTNYNNANARDPPHFVGSHHQPGILDQFQPVHPQSRPGKHEAVSGEQLESDKIHVFRRGQPRILHDNPDRLGGTLDVERNALPAPPLLPHPDRNLTDANTRVDRRAAFSERNRVLTKFVPDKIGDGTIYKKFKEDNSVTDQVRKVDSSTVLIAYTAADQVASVSPISPLLQRLPNVRSDGTVVGPSHSQLTEYSKAGKLGDSINDHANRRSDSSQNSHHGHAKDRSANKFASQGRGESSAADSLPVVDLRNNNQPHEIASHMQLETLPDDMSGSLDYESQHAKMKELAEQRAQRLQAEEEERIKNQKAKALAKLEELNRRSSVIQKKTDAVVEVDDARNRQKAGHDVTAKTTSITEPHDITAPDSLTTVEHHNGPKHTVIHVQSLSATPTHAAVVGNDPAAHASSSSPQNTQSDIGQAVERSISQSHDISVPKPRQGYRKKSVFSEEKIPGEKPSIPVTTANVKKNVEDSVNAVAVPSHDPPAQNKNGARHLRSKKKLDDTPVSSKHVPVIFNEQSSVKVSSEPKTHTGGVIISSSIVPTEGTIVTVGTINIGGISLASMNQKRVKSPDGTHNAENSRPRPQQARRSGKHQHAVRPVEKPHGNEGTLWAPVRSIGQNEQSDGAVLNTTVADPIQPAGKNSNDGDNITRTKRSEMERYVPEPLSKELQQHNPVLNLQSEKPYVDNKSHGKEAVEKSTGPKLDTTAEPKKWEDKKSSKGHGKSHPSWRRRNTEESALVASNLLQADNSHEPKVQIATNQNHSVEPDKEEEKQLKSKADAAALNSLGAAQTVPLPASTAKENNAANRQRRQHVKAQRNEASSFSNESKDREGRTDFVYQSATLAMYSNSSNHMNASRSDVKNSGILSHARAHWKPKSNSQSQNISDGNVSVEGQVDTDGGRLDMNSSKASDCTTRQDSSGKPMKSINDIDGKDARGEQGNLTQKDDNEKSETHKSAEQHQVNPSLRRQGQHNARYQRGGGVHRGRGGYDAGRSRVGSHLEYQPVGSHNRATDFQQNPTVEERTEGPHASGPVFRERGHNRGPRPAGHFVRRNPASSSASNSFPEE